MTIRTTPEITFGPNDFKRTDRGVTWGIKVTEIAEATFVAVFVLEGDRWTVGAMLDDGLDMNQSEYPDMRDWLRLKCVPNLNAWLAFKFPALGAPPSMSRAAQADALIQGLRITMNPADGTLTASVPT